jgi:cytochrome c553
MSITTTSTNTVVQTRRIELVAHGEEVYMQRRQSCHGATGEGAAEKIVPRLAGQHYGYLVREMHNAVAGRRPNFSIKHIRLLQKLARDDFVGLADFLSRANPAREAPRKRGFPRFRTPQLNGWSHLFAQWHLLTGILFYIGKRCIHYGKHLALQPAVKV